MVYNTLNIYTLRPGFIAENHVKVIVLVIRLQHSFETIRGNGIFI